jgi:hypothetical protein
MRIKYLLIFLIVLVATNSLAAGGKKDIGIGVYAGDPDGITGKYMLKNNRAVAGGVGWKTTGDKETQIYGDYLFYKWNVIQVPEGKLALYFGGGGRYISYGDDDGRKKKKDDEFGLRIPVGIEYFFWQSQLGAFMEFVPVLNLTPDTEFDSGGAIGIRFFF